jgi:hypothetical protein
VTNSKTTSSCKGQIKIYISYAYEYVSGGSRKSETGFQRNMTFELNAYSAKIKGG